MFLILGCQILQVTNNLNSKIFNSKITHSKVLICQIPKIKKIHNQNLVSWIKANKNKKLVNKAHHLVILQLN